MKVWCLVSVIVGIGGYWRQQNRAVVEPYGKWVVLVMDEKNRLLGSIYRDYIISRLGYSICQIQETHVKLISSSTTQYYNYSSSMEVQEQLPIHLGHCYTNGGIAYAIVLLNNNNNNAISYQQSIMKYLQFQNSGTLLHSSPFQLHKRKNDNTRTISIPKLTTTNVDTILQTVVKPSLHPLSLHPLLLQLLNMWYSVFQSIRLDTPKEYIHREKES